MDTVWGTLTVFFEGPFWVGIFSRTENGKLSACKVTFGAEPKDGEVWDFVLKNYRRLVFSPSVDVSAGALPPNPKQTRRSAEKQLAHAGTKSQQALQLQREEGKLQRRSVSKAQKEAEKERRFALKQQKRKEKHRGR